MNAESAQSDGDGKSIETVFNVALGIVVSRTTAKWRRDSADVILAEKLDVFEGSENRTKRPDVLIIDPQMPPVAIESSYSAADADKDAINRLGLQPKGKLSKILTAIAVHIPIRYQKLNIAETVEELRQDTEIRFAVHQRIESMSNQTTNGLSLRRWPQSGFLEGSVFDLVSLIQGAALPKEELEKVAALVADLVDNAARTFQRTMRDSSLEQLSHVVLQRSPVSALRTSMVLWLNALLTQERLAQSDVEGIEELNLNPLPRSLLSTNDYIQTWTKIQKRNWRSIFEPALNVLKLLANIVPNLTVQALFQLIRGVRAIEEAGIGLHINVGAELFPKLSEDRKEAAAFYTQAASAELLASLTIKREELSDEEWSNAALFDTRCIADLACGTGTLLRAGYARVASFHEISGGTTSSLSRLHQHAMEHGLIGTDISPIASHLTASSLAAIGHGLPYEGTRVGWVEVGGSSNATGSLEFFERHEVSDLFDSLSPSGSSRGEAGEAYSVVVPDGSLDWILMNPPYSRTRGGQSTFDIAGLSERERKACQRRWQKLVQNEPVTKTAGMAASFLALARKKVKPGGRIGFVLPLSAAFAESWRVTRGMLEMEFEDITAVVVAAGKSNRRNAFSADTGMEEMLLTATRRKNKREGIASPIHCVTLRDPVTRCGEASELARAIANVTNGLSVESAHLPILIGDEEIGSGCLLQTRGKAEPWNPLGVVNGGLALAADHLASGSIEFDNAFERLSVDMTDLGEIIGVGPTHHLIGHVHGNQPTGAFEFYEVVNEADALNPDLALWRADSKKQTSLCVKATHKGFPHNSASRDMQTSMRESRSRFFYSRNMRWTSQSLLAASTSKPCFGGRAWNALQHQDDRILKTLVLWANSTLGLIVHWTQGQRTQAGRSTTQVEALKKIPVPDFSRLDEQQLKEIPEIFDQLAPLELLPACQAHIDDARKQIDEVVMDLLGISGDARLAVAQMRGLWCREPSVHGWNKEALSKF